MEKIFEIVVYNRLSFLNEALDKYDKWNGGFMKNVRTADNMFILNGIVQKQLLIGKSLYVYFVDFSKAFDLVNRNILFYKLMRSDWSGRVIDTLRSLYSKTKFRLKCSGMLSPAILNEIGVNQGGVCSGLLFRKYVADLEQYLMSEMGICIDETIIGHLLWADDLILFSDTITGLQKQLDGVMKFCSHNRMIVNESKTKFMQFGKRKNLEVYFNGSKIDEVLEYKYLGVIRAIQQAGQDIFLCNYQYLCDQAHKAIFCAQRTTKNIEPLTPEMYFYLFDSLVRPILTYGSEVWGFCKSGLLDLDRVFLRYMRCILRVKATTSNFIVIGECGQFPPSVSCHISLLSFFYRLFHMPNSQLVKQVYNQLFRLHEQGFSNWITSVLDLSKIYNIDVTSVNRCFRNVFKFKVKEYFINEWRTAIKNTDAYPILRTYNVIKTRFGTEPYLSAVKNIKFRIAISKLRTSSHALAIERGRYTNPKTPVHERLCHSCKKIEDEYHFVMECKTNCDFRETFLNKLKERNRNFATLSQREQFVYIFTNEDNMSLTWLGKFIYKSFQRRNSLLSIL